MRLVWTFGRALPVATLGRNSSPCCMVATSGRAHKQGGLSFSARLHLDKADDPDCVSRRGGGGVLALLQMSCVRTSHPQAKYRRGKIAQRQRSTANSLLRL